MKLNISRAKVLTFSVIGLAILGLIILPGQHPQKAAQGKQTTVNKQHIDSLVKGLAEAQLTSSSSSLSPVVAVNSMANAMELRSKVVLSPVVRDTLISMEGKSLSGKSSLISFDHYVDVLTTSVLEQAIKLTDEEISLVIKTSKGFNDDSGFMPDSLKPNNRNVLGIFPGYYIEASDSEAFRQIKASANSNAQVFLKPILQSKIKEKASTNLSNFAKASPVTFGNAWDNASNQPKGLTPMQAMVLTYTLASGDSFADTTTELSSQMQQKHDGVVKRYGTYPSPYGQAAYGANGYLFSSPFALFFNEQNQLNLLSKFSSTK